MKWNIHRVLQTSIVEECLRNHVRFKIYFQTASVFKYNAIRRHYFLCVPCIFIGKIATTCTSHSFHILENVSFVQNQDHPVLQCNDDVMYKVWHVVLLAKTYSQLKCDQRILYDQQIVENTLIIDVLIIEIL